MAHDGRRKRWLMFGAAVLPAVMVIAGLWMAGTKGRKYETVTVCMPAYRNVDDLTMVQDAVNKITEERYGISFEFHMISSANYLKSMEIALLDPSLDIMLINGKPLFQHVEDQQLVDLTDYMGRASEEMRGLWTDEILRGVSVGGRLYGLPTFRNFGNYIGLNLDEEIAAEFGVRDRQKMTMEEVDVLLHEIKRRYPDRNVLVPQGMDTMIAEWTWDGLGDADCIGVLPDCGQATKVQNLYETDDFIEFCTWMRRWQEDGLIMEDVLSNVEQWQDLIYQKRGIACLDNYGVNSVSGMIRTVIVDNWSVSNSYSILMYCISANSAHKDIAWKGMEILYTDRDVEILLNNGIEGVHYVKNEDGTASYPPGVTVLNSTYAMMEVNWATPYSRYAYPLDVNGADFAGRQEAFNREALKSKASGFIFNPVPVSWEYEACCEVYDKYTPALMSGVLELEPALERAKEEFREAGIDIVIQEKQRQLDEYLEGVQSY